jgi:sarcosine oxidase
MGYGADQIYTRSAMRLLALWREFVQRTGRPLFHQTGVLWISAPGHAYSESTRVTLARCGVRFETLSTDELSARSPK